MVGSIVGPYRIIEPLGEGGMGVVYRAHHETSEQPVALKTVKALAPTWVHGIRREIHALNRIRHPGIVRILDHGVFEGRPWYAMALLEGESLRRRIHRTWSPFEGRLLSDCATEILSATESLSQSGPAAGDDPMLPSTATRGSIVRPAGVPPAAAGDLAGAVSLVQQICGTLSFLHGEGFINCDLKPENILLVDERPVIIDFGLSAYHPGGSGREFLQPVPGRAGTKAYMSPEQRRGELVDARSDLYAIGCILYELVVGQPPYRPAPGQVEDGPRLLSPSELARDVPPALEAIILKLLADDPSDRYGYADEVALELARLGGKGQSTSSLPEARPYLYRARFVGRDSFMERLGALRNAAIEGRGAMALLGGESGVGKTRLAIELTRVVSSRKMRIIMTEVTPRAAEAPVGGRPMPGAPLQALRPLLEAIAERCEAGGEAVTASLLGGRLSVLAPYEPALAQLALRTNQSPAIPLAPEAARRRLFADLAETLSRFAAEKPLFWVFDDLGWADELSLSFLKSLSAEFLARTPMFLLGSYRTEEANEAIAEIAKLEHVVHSVLPRLDPNAVRSMAGDMLALRDPPDGFVDFVEGQAEGNPFFVAEYMRAAVSERVLFRNQGQAWELFPGSDPSMPGYANLFPRPLRELIERRIRDLSAGGQLMALAAAVLGRETEIETLYEVASLDERDAIGALDELVRRQVLDPLGGETVRFAHDKLREVTYGVAPAERLKALHGRAANAIERRLEGDGASNRSNQSDHSLAVLGHHFAAADEPRKAAPYLKRAADYARSAYANADAIRLYEEAILQAERIGRDATAGSADRPALDLQLHESLGDILALTGRREEARQAYDRAFSRAPALEAAPRSRILRKQGRTWETHHQHAEALRFYGLAQSALAIEPQSASPEERDEWIQVRIDQLWVHYWLNHVGDMDVLCRALEPVIEHHGSPAQRARFHNTQTLRNLRRDSYFVERETLGFAQAAITAAKAGVPPGEFHMAQVTYGLVLLLHDSLDEAHEEIGAALAYSKRAGDSAQQARCLTYLTLAARRRHMLRETEEYVAESTAVATEAGMREYIAAAHANRAWVLLQKGDLEGSQAAARKALADWNELPAAFPFRWMALLPLFEATLAANDLGEALTCAEAVLAKGQHRLPVLAMEALRRAVDDSRSAPLDVVRGVLAVCLEQLRAARYR